MGRTTNYQLLDIDFDELSVNSSGGALGGDGDGGRPFRQQQEMLETAVLEEQGDALAVDHYGSVAIGRSFDFYNLPVLLEFADLQLGRERRGGQALGNAAQSRGTSWRATCSWPMRRKKAPACGYNQQGANSAGNDPGAAMAAESRV